MHKLPIDISEILLQEIDEMIQAGFYTSREEAVNDACDKLIKEFKVSKLREKDRIQNK